MTTVIVGAGLSGLYAAWRLAQLGEDVMVLEARSRVGGRMLSERIAPDGPSYDLGPAWIWPDDQPKITWLLYHLGIDTFTQFDEGAMLFEPQHGAPQAMPPQPMGPPSHRVAGGTQALADSLVGALPDGTVKFRHSVNRISLDDDAIQIRTLDSTFSADRVMLALPPRLIAAHLLFTPSLPHDILNTFRAVPTWMAAHAKFVAVYDRPFWRDAGLSGHAFSYRGPMMEIHDASPQHDGPFALFGFVGVPAASRKGHATEVETAAVQQLGRLFGEDALHPISVLCKDWSQDELTATADDLTAPAAHPTYGPLPLPDLWRGRVDLIGTEVAPANGGYLEGCLEAVDAVLG